MRDALMWIGKTVGVIGVVVGAIAALERVSGHYTVGGFQVGTLLLAGIAAIVAGCFALLWVLASRGWGGRS